MTLAVSAIYGREIYLMSDLKLSYEEERNSVAGIGTPEDGLKLFFLSRRIAVTYSGTSESAHQAITQARALASAGNGSAGVASFLKKKADETNDEFLLADISGRRPTVYKISANLFSSTRRAKFWIGDRDAADTLLRNNNLDSFSLERNFQELLESRRIPTVGGIAVTACGNLKGFKFVPKMTLVSPYYGTRPQAVNWGNAAVGGFGYTTLVPIEPGNNGWGVHFFQGHLGYFYRVDIDQNIYEKLTWRDTELQNAIDALQAELGITLESCGQLGVTSA
ncbi:MAG: hypothetical protein M3R18_04215 [Pseudomonadota bacterium]|nr:hypothetical protein [Pseudomonadota bacterium]